MPALRRFLKRELPDVLIAAPGLAGQFSLLASRGLPIRVIVLIDNRVTLIRSKSALHRVAYAIGSHLYKRASSIVLASDSALDDFKKTYPLLAEKACRIYHPLIPNCIEGLAAEKPSLDMPHDVRLVVSAGRLVAEKDFSTLLKSFAQVAISEQGISLLILGEGELRQELETEARNLGISERVVMPGAVSNVYPYFAMADVFVLSSVSEAFGNVIVEALSCGTPVVATRCESGGPQEILSHGKFGYLCNRGDSEGIAKAILATLQERESKTSLLKQRGAEFSIESSADQYSSLIEGLK